MAIEKVLVTKKEELHPTHIGFHPAYEYDKFEVSPRNGGNQCAVIFYDIAPGKSSYPFHYHSGSEEIFYIISGQGIVERATVEFPFQPVPLLSVLLVKVERTGLRTSRIPRC